MKSQLRKSSPPRKSSSPSRKSPSRKSSSPRESSPPRKSSPSRREILDNHHKHWYNVHISNGKTPKYAIDNADKETRTYEIHLEMMDKINAEEKRMRAIETLEEKAHREHKESQKLKKPSKKLKKEDDDPIGRLTNQFSKQYI